MKTLGDRMKDYEAVSKTRLIKRMPVIIRLDGRAFHTFTRGLKKPYDEVFINAMKQTVLRLVKEVQNCVFAYTQSDEITLVLVDYKALNTDCWFDNEVQKIVSISASLATIYFNKAFEQFANNKLANISDDNDQDLKYVKTLRDTLRACPVFDSRVFNVPENDVVNAVIWRQQDCIKNSINSVAQSMFTRKQIEGKSGKERVEMMLQEKDYDFWKDTPTSLIRGLAFYRDAFGEIVCDENMPELKLTREYLEGFIRE